MDQRTFDYQYQLATYELTPLFILEELSCNNNAAIRWAVYDNPTTPKQLKNAIDNTHQIRWLAWRSNNEAIKPH